MGYILNPNVRLGAHERALIRQGYHWVSRSHLIPHGHHNAQRFQPNNPNAQPDQLDPHAHNSANTHLIVKGRLTITPIQPEPSHPLFDLRPTIDAASQSMDEKEAMVPAYTLYKGRPRNGEGCIFVEGHKILSPASAERFRNRGHIIWDGPFDHASEQEWFETEAAEGDHERNPSPIQPRVLRGLYPSIPRLRGGRGGQGRGQQG